MNYGENVGVWIFVTTFKWANKMIVFPLQAYLKKTVTTQYTINIANKYNASAMLDSSI